MGWATAIQDATAGISHIGEGGLFTDMVRNFNLASFNTAPVDGLGGYTIYQSSPVNSTDAYIQGRLALFSAPGWDYLAKFRTDADLLTNGNLWFGGFNTTAGAALLAQDPAGDHAALRFNETLGDTNWFFCSKGAGSQEATDTGISPLEDTVYYIRISARSGAVTFQLYDEAFTSIFGPAINSTFVPRDNIGLRPTCYSWTGQAADRDLQLYFCHVGQRHAA